jgi:hypothetical protein
VIVDWTDGHLSRSELDRRADEALSEMGARLDALDLRTDLRIDVARTVDGRGSMRVSVRDAAVVGAAGLG